MLVLIIQQNNEPHQVFTANDPFMLIRALNDRQIGQPVINWVYANGDSVFGKVKIAEDVFIFSDTQHFSQS